MKKITIIAEAEKGPEIPREKHGKWLVGTEHGHFPFDGGTLK